MKWKLSYINGPNCNLQSLFELPLQIEHPGDYSFCVYLNKANVFLGKKAAQTVKSHVMKASDYSARVQK